MTEEEQTTAMVPPVAEGDILEGQEVINEGKRNDGVVKYEGYIIFVEGAKKGEVISIKMEKVLPKFGVATIIKQDEEGE